MRTCNVKTGWLVENPANDDPNPGRTTYPESQRLVESGWKGPNTTPDEFVVRREGDIEDDELWAAREWLRHLEAGRIGGSAEV